MIPSRTLRTQAARALELSVLGFGGCPLGNMYAAMSEDMAQRTLAAAAGAGMHYFDTSPFYGLGLSEERLGRYLTYTPGETVLSTKIGRVLHDCAPGLVPETIFVDTPARSFTFDYSYDGVMRSFEGSLQRLGVDHVDMLLVHDIDVVTHGTDAAAQACIRVLLESGYAALDELRRSGAVTAIGVGVDEWEYCEQLARSADFDCFLLAGRYTLLDQGALTSFLPLCERRGIGVIVGGPFNSGILATGAVPGAKFDYQAAPDTIEHTVRAIAAVCAAHGIALRDAALQFPLHHPAVVSVLPGAANPQQVVENAASIATPIPADLWRELKHEGLLCEEAPC